jgi:acyl carrier protein
MRIDVVDDPALTEAVRALVAKTLNIRVASNEEDLLTTGILDSLNLVRLISRIEEAFAMELPINEVGLESLRSVESIARLVEQRRSMAGTAAKGPAILERSGVPDQIRSLLEEKLSIRVEDVEADLFQGGFLDSMSLVQLILELESHFGLDLPIQDLDIAVFGSVAQMASLIEQRKQAGAA